MPATYTLLVTGSGLVHAAHPGESTPLCGATRQRKLIPFGTYPGIKFADGACAECYKVAGVR